MKIVFFGTPNAAVPSLEALVESPHRVIAVVTAPDRPQGRGMKLDSPPAKKAAERAGIEVFQTSSVKTPEAQERLRRFDADVFVVVAFGLILPKEVLEMTPFGCINVHFSLLPALRGAAPVQRALMEGHSRTGVTIMQLDEGMDTGPMLARIETEILPDDNTESLEQRLADIGAKLLREVVDRIEKSEVRPQPQDDSLATAAPKISGEEAHIDWAEPARVIANKVRGLTPRPGAFGVLNGKRIKIWKGRASDTQTEADLSPGAFIVEGDELSVQTGSGRFVVEELQPEGKGRMSGADFVRGYRPGAGDRIL